MMERKTKVRVIRFISPSTARLEEGIIEEGILRVGNKTFLLFNPNTKEYVNPIVVDRGIFGKELLFIVSDVYPIPLQTAFVQKSAEYNIEEFLSMLNVDEKVKEEIRKNAEKFVIPHVMVDISPISFEWKGEVPRFIGSLLEANFASYISKEMKKEATKFNVKDIVILALVAIGAMIIMFSLMGGVR